jgi:hypothetical protein
MLLVSFEHRPAGLACPGHNRIVSSSPPEGQPASVGAERHTGHRVGAPGEGLADLLAGVGVPQPDGHRPIDAHATGSRR